MIEFQVSCFASKKHVLSMRTGCKLEEDVYLESEKQLSVVTASVCFQIERDRSLFCVVLLFLFQRH